MDKTSDLTRSNSLTRNMKSRAPNGRGELCNGSPAPSFTELLEDYGNMGMAVAMGILENFQDANDAHQEAVINAYQKFDSLQDPSRFAGWMSQIVRNKCYDMLRHRHYRYTHVSLNDIKDDDDSEFSEWLICSEDEQADSIVLNQMEQERQAEIISNAIRQLEPVTRKAVTLRYVLGYTIRQTEVTMGVNAGTIKSKCHRGIKELRRLCRER